MNKNNTVHNNNESDIFDQIIIKNNIAHNNEMILKEVIMLILNF